MDGKREFLRFDVPISVEFKLQGSTEDKYLLGELKDFSRKGLSFVSQRFDAKSSQDLELKLKLPGKDVIVSCRGEIAWKKDVENNVVVGMRIKDMDAAEKGEVLEYVYNKWVERISAGN